jgi:hypothetical protein
MPNCSKPLIAGANEEVALSGTLRKRFVWGPPNFGERPNTDKKLVVWVVHLDFPRHAIAPDYTTGHPNKFVVRTIQIRRRLGTAYGYEEFERRHVVVRGKILAQLEYDDVMPIIVDPTTVSLGGKVGCNGRALSPKI